MHPGRVLGRATGARPFLQHLPLDLVQSLHLPALAQSAASSTRWPLGSKK
jgi:hypothetical protein